MIDVFRKEIGDEQGMRYTDQYSKAILEKSLRYVLNHSLYKNKELEFKNDCAVILAGYYIYNYELLKASKNMIMEQG